MYQECKGTKRSNWVEGNNKYKEAVQVVFSVFADIVSRLGKKKILSAFLKNEREVPQRQRCSQWKFSISTQSHRTTKGGNPHLVYCDELQYISVGVQAFSLPVQVISKAVLGRNWKFQHQKVLLPYCLRVVLAA